MLRSTGFTVTAHPESEVYICRRVEAPHGGAPVHPARSKEARP
jgi:tRNA (mo5U34)-methyltransferase